MRSKVLHGVTVAVLLLVACGVAIPAGSETVGHADPAFAAAIATSREVLAERTKDLPGLAVAVMVDGKQVWTSGFGWANVEAKSPMKPDTPERVYSVTKTITAALAMRLVERGKLDLDAPIGNLLPWLPPQLRAITTAQLLSHTSGIRHYNDGEWLKVSSRPCATPREGLQPILNDPLLFPPGTKTEYSSFGFVLASAVIEAAGGRPFNEQFDEVFKRSQASVIAYEPGRFGRVRVARPVENSCKFGAGALVATAPELAAFGSALLDGKIVSPASLQRMTTARGDFGLGLGVANDERLGPIAAQSGASIGGMAYLLLAPRDRVVVAIVSNMEGDRFRDDARAIARAFATAKAAAPR